MISFDFDFRSRQPGRPVGRAVQEIWYARGTVPYRSELIAPTGSTVILLTLGDPIRQTPASGEAFTSAMGSVIGPHIAPVENAPEGETFAVGVVTTAVGCEPTTATDPSTLSGRVTGLDAIAHEFTELRSSLAGGVHDPEHMLDEVESRLEQLVRLDRPGLERVEKAVSLLEDAPRMPISDLAESVGVTHAHLDREFKRVVGLSPRSLARLLLLRRILDSIDPSEEISWADIAFENGWSDQAHFSRDFKRHTGVTPTHYLSTQRAISSSGGDGTGFTPDLDDLR